MAVAGLFNTMSDLREKDDVHLLGGGIFTRAANGLSKSRAKVQREQHRPIPYTYILAQA